MLRGLGQRSRGNDRTGLIFAIWVVGDIILGLAALMTRAKKIGKLIRIKKIHIFLF